MLLIIDVNNMAYRALFTVGELAYKGHNTSVLYGCMNMIKSVLHQYEEIDSVLACFDGGTPKFRRELVPSYKDNRKDKSEDSSIDWEDVFRQIEELYRFALPMHGIATVKHKGIEADDFMAAASRASINKSIIYSGDDDLLQCISEDVSILNPNKGLLTIDDYKVIYGHHPRYHLVRKALEGDGSDNVPGVKGIGTKTATKIAMYLEDADIQNPCAWVSQHMGEGLKDIGFLRSNQRESLKEVGSTEWNNRVTCMDLSADYAGALKYMQYRIDTFDKKKVQRWLMSHGFISLADNLYYRLFSRLVQPVLHICRTPTYVHKFYTMEAV